MKLSDSWEILKRTWRQESGRSEKRSFGFKLLRAGMLCNTGVAVLIAAAEASGLCKTLTAELMYVSLVCLFVFFMMLEIMRRSAFVFFSDRRSGRSLLLELAPCGYGADFLVKTVKIVLPWCADALAVGGVLFFRELISGSGTAAPFGFLTVSIFGMLAALGAGMAWSCRSDFTARGCSDSATVFFGLFFILFLIGCVGERITQTEILFWAVSLFCLSWAPRFNLCSERLCLLLSVAAAVSSFLPAVRSCKADVFEYAVPYATASYIYDLRTEAEQEIEDLAASAEAQSGGADKSGNGRGKAEDQRVRSETEAEQNEEPVSPEAALERILSCGFISLLIFAAGLTCLRLKGAEPL